MRSQRLFRRVWFSYVVLLTTLVLAWVWWGYFVAQQSQLQSQSNRLQSIARSFMATNGDLITDGVESKSAQQALLKSLGRIAAETKTRIIVLPQSGTVLNDRSAESVELAQLSAKPEFKSIFAGEVPLLERKGDWVLLPWQAGDKIIAAVHVSPSVKSADGVGIRAGWLVAAAWLALLVLGYIILRGLLVSVEETAQYADQITKGHWPGRLPRCETIELTQITEAFNYLIEQLAAHSHAMGRKGTEHEAVLASMVEGVLAVDSEERIIAINRAAAEVIETHPADATSKNLSEVIRNADLRRFVLRALESSESIVDDIVLLGARRRILQAHGTALRDTTGAAIGAVIVLDDVTHTRNLENIRRDFVANVSHELKTPISSIKGFVETLLDGALNSPTDAERFLKIIARQADRLDSIIEDLLSLSKIEQSEEAKDLPLEPCNVLEILYTAMHDYETRAEERKVQVKMECESDLSVMANARLLVQAVGNLVDNAIKYSEAGKAIFVSAAQSATETTIVVRDEGCGIDREHLPRLFERFYRVDKARSRKLGGTGLGLAIVKHIVQAHRGRVEVDSTLGQGSTFRIVLPKIAAK